MSKVKCVVVSERGPRLIVGTEKGSGKAIRQDSKRGDVVSVSPEQLAAWSHQLKPVEVYEAEQAAIKAAGEAEAAAKRAVAERAKRNAGLLTDEQVDALQPPALKDQMAKYEIKAADETAARTALKAKMAELRAAP